jgi:hypothetical protein
VLLANEQETHGHIDPEHEKHRYGCDTFVAEGCEELQCFLTCRKAGTNSIGKARSQN